ncbi:MAG: hypothetical protein ACJ8OJ_01805, partial [Povalibacter sp.]
ELLLLYAAASLLHFIHNAEYLAAYPGLPVSWSRFGVYGAWIAMSSVGVIGWVLLRRGYEWLGLLLLTGYAALGMDSLGHYVLASFSQHTLMMNATILLEVTAATLVMIEVVRRMTRKAFTPLGSRTS